MKKIIEVIIITFFIVPICMATTTYAKFVLNKEGIYLDVSSENENIKGIIDDSVLKKLRSLLKNEYGDTNDLDKLYLFPTIEYVNIYHEYVKGISIHKYYIDVAVNTYIAAPSDAFIVKGTAKAFVIHNIIPLAAIQPYKLNHKMDYETKKRYVKETLSEIFKKIDKKLVDVSEAGTGDIQGSVGFIKSADYDRNKTGIEFVEKIRNQLPALLAGFVMEKSNYVYCCVGFPTSKDAYTNPDKNRKIIQRAINILDVNKKTKEVNKIELIYPKPDIIIGLNIKAGGRRIEKESKTQILLGYKFWLDTTITNVKEFVREKNGDHLTYHYSRYENDKIPRINNLKASLEASDMTGMGHNIISNILYKESSRDIIKYLSENLKE